MNWTHVWNRLKGSPAGHEADLEEELAFHAEMKARDLTAEGLSKERAQWEARRALGNLTLAREDARAAWHFSWLADALQDARYGVRTLTAQPGFTASALLALVLGIGVNALLFSVYNALALSPYELRDASQTVQVWGERGASWHGFTWPEYRYLRAETRTLTGLIGTSNAALRVVRGASRAAWNGEAAAVSDNFFDVVGTGFATGQGFSPEAGRVHDPAPEMVLQYDTWVAPFGADPGIVGEWLEVNGHPLRVTGVAAPGFSGPGAVRPIAWIPAAWLDIFEPDSRTYDSASSCCASVIGRLKPGVSRSEVQAELTALSAQFRTSIQQEKGRVRVTTPTLLANPKAQAQALPMFLVLAIAAGLILLLACANVANLQIARAVARQREIAIRLALGAGRGRLLRQMLVESLMIASLAGAVSLLLAQWGPGPLVTWIADEARGLAIRFDTNFRVIAFIAGVTFLAALLSGLTPAWAAVGQAAGQGLRDRSRSVTSRGRLRHVLLGVQVALSAVLVSGTTLMVRVADHTSRLHPGFSHEDVIQMNLGLDSSGATDEQSRALIAALTERIAALPGVKAVSHSAALPLGRTNMAWGGVRDPRGGTFAIGFDRVSANFFDTLRIPLLAGAGFTKDDEINKDVAVISQSTAQRLFPDESPLGKPLYPGSTITVVGVAANITTRHFGSEHDPYMWLASRGLRGSRLLIRHDPGQGDALRAALPALARQQDRRFLPAVLPYSQTVANARHGASMTAAVAAMLGSLSLLLACVGIYGVASHGVSQRAREIGVRLAMGAQPSGILLMVLRQNLRTVLAGVAAGLAGALAFAQLLRSVLYGLSPADPTALAAAFGILLATSLLATWAPAQYAARIDPSITLRED